MHLSSWRKCNSCQCREWILWLEDCSSTSQNINIGVVVSLYNFIRELRIQNLVRITGHHKWCFPCSSSVSQCQCSGSTLKQVSAASFHFLTCSSFAIILLSPSMLYKLFSWNSVINSLRINNRTLKLSTASLIPEDLQLTERGHLRSTTLEQLCT